MSFRSLLHLSCAQLDQELFTNIYPMYCCGYRKPKEIGSRDLLSIFRNRRQAHARPESLKLYSNMADYDHNRGYGRDRYRGSFDGYDLDLFQHAGCCIEPYNRLFDMVLLFF